MASIINSSVNKDVEPVITDLPSEEEQKVVSRVFEKFRQTADNRNRNFQYFDGLTLTQYIEDSVDRYVTNVYEREGLEDWQARAHTPVTRDKVGTFLSRVAAVLPIMAFKTRGEDDPQKGRVATDMYHFSEDLDDYEEFIVNVLQEAIVKGKAIAYEGHTNEKRKIRNKTKKDGKTIITEAFETRNKLFGRLVRLEDFYPESVGLRNIKLQPSCFWRDTMNYEDFLKQFSNFDKVDQVKPQRTIGEEEERPFYLDFISESVGEGEVEIIRYYSVLEDEFVILANGVWMNPVATNNGEEVDCIPFKHKELPFWDIKFESFGDDFFYGKSLPDKLKSFQDVLNVLTNMLLDQSFLTIFPPMLTSGFDGIEDDYLRPGRRTPIDTQGQPLKDAFHTLEMKTPSNWHQFILSYTKDVMEQASVDQVTSGQAGVGERTTAKEISKAAEGVAAMFGLFGTLIKIGLKRKAYLRVKNIMQYWTDKDSPVMFRSDQKEKGAFNVFRMKDSTLTGGKRGQKVIEMYSDRQKMPTKGDLRLRQELFEAETGKRMEIVAIPAKYIRDIDLDIEAIANPKLEQTKEMRQAMAIEKTRTYMSFFPDRVNVDKLLSDLAEAFDDDPTEIMKQEQPQMSPAEGAVKGQQDNGVGTVPQTNVANNVARGARGGENLQASMLG